MSDRSSFGIIHDKKPMDPGRKSVLEEGLKALIQHNFNHPEKWFVYSNLKKYKPSMSVDIYGQKIGKLPEICEVYCNGEFVCEVNTLNSPKEALLMIQKGLADILIRRKEISLRKAGKL